MTNTASPTSGDWIRVSRKNLCPICNHKDNCSVSEDGNAVYCRRWGGYSAPPGWNFLKEGSDGGGLFRKENAFRDTVGLGAEFWEKRRKAEQAKETPTLERATLAGESQRAAALSWLLSRLELSKEHALYLKKEGFGLEEADRLEYRTLPGDSTIRRAILTELDAEFSREVTRGLGFVYERQVKAGKTMLLFSSVAKDTDALLVPIRNLEGLPVALLARWEDGEGDRQYKIMSAGSTELGASVGTPIHVARPAAPGPLKGWVIVTEGARKADYAAAALGVTVLGILGVSTWRSGGLLPLLSQLKAKTIVEAYDADLLNNQDVARQARAMAEQCAGAGYRVFNARWKLEQGKGLDDFLRNQDGEEYQWPNLAQFGPTKPAKNQQEDTELKKRYGVSGARATRIANEFVILDTAPDQAQVIEVLTLAEARTTIRTIFAQTFRERIAGGKSQVLVLKATTGTGKSYEAIEQIKEHLTWQRPGRILYLTNNKLAYAAHIQHGGAFYDDKRVAVREGRSPDKNSPYYCKKYSDCQTAGQSRHPAAVDVCGSCLFGSERNWAKHLKAESLDAATPMPWNCQKDGYLKTVEATKTAQLVIAPADAELNGSKELSTFDFIIIDEDCLSKLLETQTLILDQLREWEEARRRLEVALQLGQQAENEEDEEKELTLEELKGRHEPFDQLGQLLESTLIEFDQASREPGRARFLEVLQSRAEADGVDLDELVEKCYFILPSARLKRYDWEKPFVSSNRLVAPLRLARDLVSILWRELASDRDPEADTQLWIERRQGCQTAIVAYIPRKHILNIIQGKADTYKNEFETPPTVLFLDATAGPEFKLAVPSVKEIDIRVHQPTKVIQVRNNLFSPTNLTRSKNLETVSRTIAATAQRLAISDVTVFSRKQFNPNETEGPALAVAGVERVRYGHFEKHNKGLNDYQDTQMIAVVGPCSDPIDEIEARVMAFRRRKTGLEPLKRSPEYTLKAYQWKSSDGQGLARWCKTHADPDVQAAIDFSLKSRVMQTIGRGRAALRPASEPLIIMLFTSQPIEGLPVEELTTTHDLLDEQRVSEAQRAALKAGRTENNAESSAKTLAKIAAAKLSFAATGKSWVSIGRFATAAGVSRATLWKLGYRKFIRVREIRDVFSLDLFISKKQVLSKPPSQILSRVAYARQPETIRRC